jgi:hypothetical protein
MSEYRKVKRKEDAVLRKNCPPKSQIDKSKPIGCVDSSSKSKKNS